MWPDIDALRAQWRSDAQWAPIADAAARERGYRKWRKAVERTLGWVDADDA